MPRLLLQSVATVRLLTETAISVVSGAFPGSTTYPGIGGGSARYPGPAVYPGAGIYPGTGVFLFPGRSNTLAATQALPRTLTETTA